MKLKILSIVVAVVLVASNIYFFLELHKQQLENAALKNQITLVKSNMDADGRASSNMQASYEAQLADLKAKTPTTTAETTQSKTIPNRFPGGIVSKNSTDFKTVRLTNGQSYYGIVSSYTSGVVTLVDIYYIQGFQDFSEPPAQNQQAISLVKRGNELDAPEDRMLINDLSITSIETLSQDSSVFKAIVAYKNQ